MYQTDVERAQELMLQKEAQNQANFRAMVGELEWKKMEFTGERCLGMEKCEMALHAKQAESEAVLHAKQTESDATIWAEWIRSNEKQAELNTKWVAWVNQLQAEQAKKQKDVSDNFVRHIADLKQQDERYSELQQRLHMSESSAQSNVL